MDDGWVFFLIWFAVVVIGVFFYGLLYKKEDDLGDVILLFMVIFWPFALLVFAIMILPFLTYTYGQHLQEKKKDARKRVGSKGELD